MKKHFKKILIVLVVLTLALSLSGCREVARVSHNISKEADNFNVYREIVVINVRDEQVLYTLKGFFSIQGASENTMNSVANTIMVISEIAPGKYKKDFIYLSEYTTFVCTDLKGVEVDPYHYELNILPQMFVPFTITSHD